ncbi:MAG: cyclic nucleotide-binding domain-containing protein [Treponema sp.]|nr:cyclic nucleotide-binding domain-containing protein [Spirochaetia bacterium]MDD7460059.1 cyclic nucleotide-binding domain-containing protein [Spirochaetales bacterium]MDY5811047.1 cyclic nucleotide-binding domain-containing protein [Treponema sp.]
MECNKELIEKLCSLEIFSDFSPENPEHVSILEQVCSKLETMSFPKGSVIIKEGDVGDCLHILYEGTVQIKKNTLSADQFAVVNLCSEQNVFFGEVALIDKDTRSASVYALTDCKTLCLDAEGFKEICDKNPLLGYHAMFRISKKIASSLRRSNKDAMVLYQALISEVNGED